MAYIGREPQIGNYQICDAISVVNGQAAYTMQVSSVNVIPESVNHMIVSLNGVIQKPGSSYTISSSTITFSSNLATGDSIDFIYLLGNVLDLGTPSDSTVTSAKLATTLFTGATDIGAAIADADLFLMDDGAGGTIRKTTASRLKTYIGTFDTDAAQVFNESSNDVDFRVESNGNDHMLFVDGGNDCVNIGSSNDRGGMLNVEGNGGVVVRVADNNDALKLQSTDTDANAGPLLTLERTNNSAADADFVGAIVYKAQNDANEATEYAKIDVQIDDSSDGTEDGQVFFRSMSAGTARNRLAFYGSNTVINDDSQDIDFRVESNNQAHMLFVDAGNDRIGILDSSPAYTLESGNSDSGKGWSLANENNIYKIRARSDASDTQTHIQFENSNGICGSIQTNGTTAAYNTSSDYRLKENVDYDWDATTRLKQLKPARFNWITDDTNTLLDGFIAHEVSSIVPEAVSGNKDATETLENVILNADGSLFKCNFTKEKWEKGKKDGTFAADSTWAATFTRPDYQSIDQSKLVPLLVKTIQELEARIKTLEDA